MSNRLLSDRYRLFTTMYVVVETHAAIVRRVNAQVGRRFLEQGRGGINLLSPRSEDEEDGKNLVLQRLDKDYSFCDAISFVVMERFGLYLAFAYDDHFRQHGFSTPVGNASWP